MTAQLYFQLPVGLTDEMIWPDYPVENLVMLNSGLASGLAAEPEIGGGPITRFIGYKLLGKPRASRAEAQAMLPLQPGDPSPFFDPVDDISRDSNARLTRTYANPTDLATCGPTDRPDWTAVERLALLALAGGRAFWIKEENALPVYFVFPDPTAICPFGDGEESWEKWGVVREGDGEPVKYGDYWYRSSSHGAGGVNVEIDVWVPLLLAGAVGVISEADFVDVRSQYQTPPPI
jgi:hypothetical protein